jgi:hypothetical protein
LAEPKATYLIVLGAFVALLGLVFLFEALRWLLLPSTGGIGAVAASGTLIQLASAPVLLLAGVIIALFALLRGGRLK